MLDETGHFVIDYRSKCEQVIGVGSPFINIGLKLINIDEHDIIIALDQYCIRVGIFDFSIMHIVFFPYRFIINFKNLEALAILPNPDRVLRIARIIPHVKLIDKAFGDEFVHVLDKNLQVSTPSRKAGQDHLGLHLIFVINCLQAEQRNAQSQQEGLEQAVNWAQDRDVLDQGAVPQKLHEHGHDDDEQGEDNQVVESLALVTGLQNVKHLFIRG